jgi:hypothetical protein
LFGGVGLHVEGIAAIHTADLFAAITLIIAASTNRDTARSTPLPKPYERPIIHLQLHDPCRTSFMALIRSGQIRARRIGDLGTSDARVQLTPPTW